MSKRKTNFKIESYHWFFVDIVASANPDILVKGQIEKIEVLNNLIHKTPVYKKNSKSIVKLPTGDGVVLGISQNPEIPIQLAIQLHKLLFQHNKNKRGRNRLEIRIGIDTGLIGFIKDFLGRKAFWGPGLILAKRVMDLGDAGHILTSDNYAKLQEITSEYKNMFHPCGIYPIKHGKIFVYNIYGKGFGTRKQPNIPIVISPKDRFVFEECIVETNVLNPKTMNTHHRWNWKVVNPSDHPMDELSIPIGSDYPTKMFDLKLKIVDNKEKNLKPILIQDTPLKKFVKVKLEKPVKPREIRTFKIDYFVKETERYFQNTLGSDCKKFIFKLTLPKKMNAEKVNLYKVDAALGDRYLVSPTPVVKKNKNKTEIIWIKNNLKMHDAFEYRW